MPLTRCHQCSWDPHPSQQHVSLQPAVLQLQQEVIRPKQGFKTQFNTIYVTLHLIPEQHDRSNGHPYLQRGPMLTHIKPSGCLTFVLGKDTLTPD